MTIRADVLEHDFLEVGNHGSRRVAVVGADQDGIDHVANAHVPVPDVADQPAAAGVGLDADAVEIALGHSAGRMEPSMDRSNTMMLLTPPLVSLPIDMPWPVPKRLWAMVRLVVGPRLPPLMAI